MLSTLPKLADRNFIVGFFVPTLLAALAFMGLFRDVPPIKPLYDQVVGGIKWDELAEFVLAVWVVAILLMLLNHLIYRVAEGYVGPFAWVGSRRRSGRRRDKLSERRKALIQKEADPNTSGAQKEELSKQIDAIDLKLIYHFPPAQFPTLPTRFGNTIRAFESYPVIVYGVDSIAAWLRLTAVLPKQSASATADARAEVDFFLNIFFFSVIIALLASGRLIKVAIESCVAGGANCADVPWDLLWYLTGGIAIAWLAYEGAVWRAVAWGDLIKSAFDLYLPKLAHILGYTLPDTLEKRREFWREFSMMALYFEPMDPTKYSKALSDDKALRGDNAAPRNEDGERSDRGAPTSEDDETSEESAPDSEEGAIARPLSDKA
jgi:hypothetical protein